MILKCPGNNFLQIYLVSIYFHNCECFKYAGVKVMSMESVNIIQKLSAIFLAWIT